MKRENTTNEGRILQFNNGNINIHFDTMADSRRNCSDIEIVSWLLDTIDCYFIGDEYCLSNYDMGCTIYNAYSDLCYILSFSDLQESFKTGRTLKLFSHNPDDLDRDMIDSWYNG